MVHKAHPPASNYFGVNRVIGANELSCFLNGVDCAKELMGAFVDFLNYTETFHSGKWAGYPFYSKHIPIGV